MTGKAKRMETIHNSHIKDVISSSYFQNSGLFILRWLFFFSFHFFFLSPPPLHFSLRHFFCLSDRWFFQFQRRPPKSPSIHYDCRRGLCHFCKHTFDWWELYALVSPGTGVLQVQGHDGRWNQDVSLAESTRGLCNLLLTDRDRSNISGHGKGFWMQSKVTSLLRSRKGNWCVKPVEVGAIYHTHSTAAASS